MNRLLSFTCLLALIHRTYGINGNPKYCTHTNGAGLMCTVSVRIICEMDGLVDGEGQSFECLNPDRNNEKPFLTLPNPISAQDNLCGNKNVKITYRMCNRNTINQHPIVINRKFSFIKSNVMKKTFEDGAQSDNVLQPEECWETTLDNYQWDPCQMAQNESRMFFEAQFQGRVVNNPDSWENTHENVFCFCRLFKGASVEKGNVAPSQTCEQYNNFRITEVVAGKYVEIHNDLCIGKDVTEELYLVRIPFGSNTIANFQEAYSIKDVASSGVPNDGFILACDPTWTDKKYTCNGARSFPVSNGKDSYAIVRLRGNNIAQYDIIDIYGSMEILSDRTFQDIGNSGRAARDTDISAGTSMFWQPSEWYITKNTQLRPVFDPRAWTNAPEFGIQLIITEITSPLQTSPFTTPPKYVELYTDSGKGDVIDELLQLVIFHESSTLNDLVPAAVVDLRGKTVPADGFILFCNPEAEEAYGDEACDFVLDGLFSPVTSDGDDNIAIISGNLEIGNFDVLDIFGVIGEDGSMTAHQFVNSRVARDRDMFPFQNNGVWKPDNWCILPYQTTLPGPDPADPRQWNTRCKSSAAPTLPPVDSFPEPTPPKPRPTTYSPTKKTTYKPTYKPSYKPTRKPTPAPTRRPTPNPTRTITGEPTASPTKYPTRFPTSVPTEEEIEVFITEVTDPSDGPNGRFVEIYFPSNPNLLIEEDILIVRFEGTNSNPTDASFININGLRTDEHGFMVFCVSNTNYGQKCNYVLGPNTIADNPGNMKVAVMKGQKPSPDGKILDIFGAPGRESFVFENFSGGKVNRRSAPRNPTYLFNNWDVFPGQFPDRLVSSGYTDPGCWNGIGDCNRQPTISPTASPTSSPTAPTTSPTKLTDKPTRNPSNNPTDAPTIKPTATPTMKLTSPPTVGPTMYPTADNNNNGNPTNGGNPTTNGGNPTTNGGNPTTNGGNPTTNGGNPTTNGGNPTTNGGNPTQGGIYSLEVFITEITDPSDGQNGRFVELYFPFNKNFLIAEDILVVRFEGTNSVPAPHPYINLRGLRTNVHGFIVFCVDYATYTDRCDYVLGTRTIADNPGNVDLAIMTGLTPNAGGRILDIYGVPGQQTYMFQSFIGGRVNRRYGIPNPTFDYGNWDISPGYIPNANVPSSGADPGCWNGIGRCINVTPSGPSSPSSPSSQMGKGKSGGKAGKAGKAGGKAGGKAHYPGTRRRVRRGRRVRKL